MFFTFPPRFIHCFPIWALLLAVSLYVCFICPAFPVLHDDAASFSAWSSSFSLRADCPAASTSHSRFLLVSRLRKSLSPSLSSFKSLTSFLSSSTWTFSNRHAYRLMCQRRPTGHCCEAECGCYSRLSPAPAGACLVIYKWQERKASILCRRNPEKRLPSSETTERIYPIFRTRNGSFLSSLQNILYISAAEASVDCSREKAHLSSNIAQRRTSTHSFPYALRSSLPLRSPGCCEFFFLVLSSLSPASYSSTCCSFLYSSAFCTSYFPSSPHLTENQNSLRMGESKGLPLRRGVHTVAMALNAAPCSSAEELDNIISALKEELTLTYVRVPVKHTQRFAKQLKKYLFRRPEFRSVQVDTGGTSPASELSSQSDDFSLPNSSVGSAAPSNPLSESVSAAEACSSADTLSCHQAHNAFRPRTRAGSPEHSHAASSIEILCKDVRPTANAASAQSATSPPSDGRVAFSEGSGGALSPPAENDSNYCWRRIILDNTVTEELQGLPDDVRKWVLSQPGVSVGKQKVQLSYANMTAEEVLKKVLPASVEVPRRFEVVGHIAHLNLKEEQLPYRFFIARVLLDKVPALRTVVCKTGIASQWRELQFERLAGEASYVARVKENDMIFEIDYAKVYWNSRLAAERERLLRAIPPGSIVHLFAGVGAFSLFLAKRGCLVLANDGNPAAVTCMEKNIALNKLRRAFITTKNLDARVFVQDAAGSPRKLLELLRKRAVTLQSRQQAEVPAPKATLATSTGISKASGTANALAAGGTGTQMSEGASTGFGDAAAASLDTVEESKVVSGQDAKAGPVRGAPRGSASPTIRASAQRRVKSTWGSHEEDDNKRYKGSADLDGRNGHAVAQPEEDEDDARQRAAESTVSRSIKSGKLPLAEATAESHRETKATNRGASLFDTPPRRGGWTEKTTPCIQRASMQRASENGTANYHSPPAQSEFPCEGKAACKEPDACGRSDGQDEPRKEKQRQDGDSICEEGAVFERQTDPGVDAETAFWDETIFQTEVHYIMNLPELAVDFLDVFRGLLATPGSLSADEGPPESEKLLAALKKEVKHRVHCYAFSRSVPPELDFKPRVEKALQHGWPEDAEIREVRDVAPNKRMYHIGFTIPESVIYSSSAEPEAASS